MLKDNHEICPAFLLPSLCYPFVIFWLTCLGLIFKGLPWYDDDFGVDEVLWDLLQWFFCDKLCIKCHILFVNEFAGRWTNPSRSAPPPLYSGYDCERNRVKASFTMNMATGTAEGAIPQIRDLAETYVLKSMVIISRSEVICWPDLWIVYWNTCSWKNLKVHNMYQASA